MPDVPPHQFHVHLHGADSRVSGGGVCGGDVEMRNDMTNDEIAKENMTMTQWIDSQRWGPSIQDTMNDKVRRALEDWRSSNAQIHNLLYEALEAIDAPLDLLQIVGSWDDTQPREETIKQLQAFIEREKAR